MFGNHGLCGLLEEGAHEKSPKCLGGNLGDFGGILQRSQYTKYLTCFPKLDKIRKTNEWINGAQNE